MDHSDWAEQMKAALALKCKTPQGAVRALRSLASRTAKEVEKGVTDWHVEQATSLAAIILSESKAHKAAAILCRRHNQQLRAQLLYYAQALAGSLAFEAFQLSACGQEKRAKKIALEAMTYFKADPESSATHQNLVKLLEAQPAKNKAVRRGKKRDTRS